MASALQALTPGGWDAMFNLASPVLPKSWQLANPGDKAHKLAEVLTATDGRAFFLDLVSNWRNPSDIVVGANRAETSFTDTRSWPKADDLAQWMMAMDAQNYLPDDILVKVDRAAMANSLETRAPMLDHRVVELAWRIPLHQKIRQGQGKWLMRQLLYRHVPKELIERPKMGFGIPLGSWLRGPLREWAEALLGESRLRREGYLQPEPIRQRWEEHLSGRRNWQQSLWTVLMFQAWLQETEGRLS